VTDFPASAVTPGQPESRTAHQRLHDQGDRFPWWEDYLSIRQQFPHFGNWRIWVYLAWASQPAERRQPVTEIELAETVLGCTTRAIRNWKAKDFGEQTNIEQAIAWLQAAPLLRYRREIFDALVSVAKWRDPKAHSDRKLALEMLGDYNPKQTQEHTGEVETVVKVIKGVSLDDL
jgi:hypothetical protein